MRRNRTFAFPVVLVFLAVAAAQTPPARDVPLLQLKVKEKLPVLTLVRNLWGIHSQCDDKGNVYYQPPREAIVRVSADGRKVTYIDLKTLSDFRPYFSHWTVGLRGEVHLIAYNQKEGNPSLLTFDDEGKLESADPLDSKFLFYHFAVFPTGELLAAGQALHEGINDTEGEPYTAVFDRNGKLLKELSLEGDVKQQKDSRGGFMREVVLGGEVPAEDGNIYLMRQTEKHLFFVISPGGEVVRKFTLVSPSEDWYCYPEFFVAGGKILLGFYRPGAEDRSRGTMVYCLYDAESGEHQADFESSPEISGTLACYTPNQFTFLSVADDGLSLIHAVPK
jgi:hypothetical protein